MEKANLAVKAGLKQAAEQILHLQLADIKEQLTNLQAAGAGEGKSSAGDKYETQREMMKQSRDVLDRQASRITSMSNQLQGIPCHAHDQIQEGALVKLSIGWLWISVSLGKVVYEEKEYQLISNEAPLFIATKGMKTGESRLFRGKEMKVEKVL